MTFETLTIEGDRQVVGPGKLAKRYRTARVVSPRAIDLEGEGVSDRGR